MNKNELEQAKKRKLFRKLGFAFLIPGIILMGVGMFSFFISFDNFEAPQFFFLTFIGMPFTFLGSVFLGFGYMKSYASHTSKELRPIAKDNINYIVEGTKESIGDLLHEVKTDKIKCSSCGENNDKDAKFCDNCGKALVKVCRYCHEENENDAKYCKSCGKDIE
jgi:predicted RNA-binding Zn-ribbon protein involved in translation (DUF1610 family)